MWDPEEKKKWIEWNLQKDFCRKKRLIWKAYPADREHDHCEFCWAKFWADPQADEGCLKAGSVLVTEPLPQPSGLPSCRRWARSGR